MQALNASTGEVLDSDQPVAVNVEGQQYSDAKSYLMIEIVLHTALVRRRLQEELAERLVSFVRPQSLVNVYPINMGIILFICGDNRK